jgi:trafficking protein particle complex subunit 11
VPRLVAAMAEPRVMLTISEASFGVPEMSAHKLSFMIENPSMHFLTFNVSMEASEDFAFSGPKTCAVSLVPISRQTLTYRILPNKKDDWIGVHLTVVDAYFGQTLRVLSGGEGVKVDKKGNVLVKV